MTNRFHAVWLGVAVVGTMSAWGLDLTPDTTRYLSDPAFLPLSTELFSETTYSHVTRAGDWRPVGGGINQHYSAEANNYVQQFAYGLSNRLSVGIAASYTDTNARYTYLFQPGNTLATSQFNSPTLSLTYRAIEQGDNPVSLDVKAVVTPGVVDNEPRSSDIQLFASRELESLTIQGEWGAEYSGPFTTNRTLAGTPNSISSQWSYFVGARSQLRLTQGLAINSGLVYTRLLRETVSNARFGNTSITFPDGSWSPFVALSYDVIPSRFNLAFEYDHDFIGDEVHSGASNGSWINQTRNLYGAHLRLLF